MIPVLDEKQRLEIEAVSDLIKEVNVKEILFLDDASGVLVKQKKFKDIRTVSEKTWV
jgi:isoleucyl-tRNA synthetase